MFLLSYVPKGWAVQAKGTILSTIAFETEEAARDKAARMELSSKGAYDFWISQPVFKAVAPPPPPLSFVKA
jgi:hypothetical protein